MDPNQSIQPQGEQNKNSQSAPLSIRYLIVGVFTAIFGSAEIIIPLIMLFIIFPKISTLYTDLDIEQNSLLTYTPIAILIILGAINIFLCVKILLKTTTNKERYFKFGLASLAVTILFGGALQGLLILSVISPIYNVVKVNTEKNPSISSYTTPTPDPTADWKTYTDGQIEFKYPPSWNIVATFSDTSGGLLKMIDQCNGLKLENSASPSSKIVIESIEPGTTDGAYCWSGGDFSNTYKRSTFINTKSVDIDVSRWKSSEYLDEKTNQVVPSVWNGDFFQSYGFNVFNKEYPNNNWYVFALISKEGTDSNAENVFDQILSTFKFTQ